jgi:hypothetical protein
MSKFTRALKKGLRRGVKLVAENPEITLAVAGVVVPGAVRKVRSTVKKAKRAGLD